MTTSGNEDESRELKQRCAPLLRVAGLEGDFSLLRLAGGRNNRVYQVRPEASGDPLLLKSYFSGSREHDRLATEFVFSSHVWECGIRQIPRPLACSPREQLAVYQFINGRSPEHIGQSQVDAAQRFARRLNERRSSAKQLGRAVESCCCEQQHLDRVRRRLAELAEIPGETPIERSARRFVIDQLTPLAERVEARIAARLKELNLDAEARLPSDQWCLSPSDFGFHNALERESGELVFFDFEYAGWDDPAKLVTDFFCQVERPAPLDSLPSFAEGVADLFPNPAATRGRIERLLPLYRLKWCCIVLNEFLPDGAAQAFGAADNRSRLEEQLAKAESLVNSLSEEHA